MEATYMQNYNRDDLNLFFEDQTVVESFSEKRKIKDIINQLFSVVNIESEESYKSCNYSATLEETNLSTFKLNTPSNLLFDNNIDKKNLFDGVFRSLFDDVNPYEDVICFLTEDNNRICINRNEILNRKSFFYSLNYFQPQPVVEEVFKYEELDFPVRIKPRESFKIRIKVNSVRSNQLNPRLELD